MYEQSHKIIQRYLKKGDVVVEVDKKTFTKYMNKQIDIVTCMELFRENNNIPRKQLAKIRTEDFIFWLKEIGYERYGL